MTDPNPYERLLGERIDPEAWGRLVELEKEQNLEELVCGDEKAL